MAINENLAYELCSNTLRNLTSSADEWRKFLKTSSYMYQYSFNEQVLIYAQRPLATAVADYDTWNEKIGRWIHKNAEAITLLDYTGKRIRRKFVFDISDTYQKFGMEYKIWRVNADDNEMLKIRLENEFGKLEKTNTLAETVISAVNNIYMDNINDYHDELMDSVEFSLLNGLNSNEIEKVFENIIKSSLIFEVLTRCDINPDDYLPKECFNAINYFDSVILKNVLGTTCCDLSRTLLRKIREYANNKNYTVDNEKENSYYKNDERSVEDGRIIQNERTEDNERGVRSNGRDLFESKREILERTQESTFSNDDSKSGIDTTSKSNSRRGNEDGGRIDSENEDGAKYNREIESNGSVSLGRQNEQHKSGGTRNSNERTNLQINIFDNTKVGVKNNTSTFFMPQNVEDANKLNQFSITTETLGEDTLKNRYKNNIDAIKIQIICDNEKRNATIEEQNKLSKYVGWGGLEQAFDANNAKWTNEYKELKSLLTNEEYEKARASTLTAFYTPPIVIKSMYNVLKNLGFKNGNILEPSCGIGNFIGMIPEAMQDSRFYGIELDKMTGEIAKLLYPKSHIEIKGFEETEFKDNTFDVAIGNIPFGDFRPADARY